jgi:hypothetical protein
LPFKCNLQRYNMGLLWNPAPAVNDKAPAVSGPKGRFCFFDADSDFAKYTTVDALCSSCTYETHAWHHAYVTVGLHKLNPVA